MSRLIAILTALLAVALLPVAAHAAAPEAARQWEARNAGSVQTGTAYSLFNTRNNAQVGYDGRVFGIDMGWVTNGGQFEFRRATAGPNIRDHRRGVITETEDVAIYNTKTRRYLKFYKRGDWKAELEWDSTPRYEWQVRGQAGNRFALFNDRVDRYLVHQVKNYGINLGWLAEGPPPVQSFSVGLSAQPVTQGWIPYLGSFGGGTQGSLLSVQNASQTATLLFVKPGRQTSQCGDPAATVPLAPRASLTADQVKTLYGIATPRLPVTFLACATTPTTGSLGLTFVNITYRLDA